jgi:hypothetical protein
MYPGGVRPRKSKFVGAKISGELAFKVGFQVFRRDQVGLRSA